MLPAPQRMRHKRDFDTAVRRGRRVGRRTLVVHAATPFPGIAGIPDHVDGSQPPARVGFIVSKGVGSAVIRNTVKRRLRALARARLMSLPAGALVVVRANPAAATASATALAADLDSAIARAFAIASGRAPEGHR